MLVATRTEDNRSRFRRISNLPNRDTARLLTRAALEADSSGVADVLMDAATKTP